MNRRRAFPAPNGMLMVREEIKALSMPMVLCMMSIKGHLISPVIQKNGCKAMAGK